MIKYVGLFLIALSAFFITREYEAAQKKRLFEVSEFIRLFKHIKNRISTFLSPKEDWLSDFSTSSQEIEKFLLLARDKPLPSAFMSLEDAFSLGDERELIARALFALGEGYRDEVVAELNSSLSLLSEKERALSGECEKNVKTVRVIAAAASLGLIILLI